MNVHRNEAKVVGSILAAHAAYKKDAESKETAPSGPANKTINIPENDAAVANIQHPINTEMTKTLQDIINRDITQTKINDSSDNKTDDGKKISMEESELLKKLKEAIERTISSDIEETIITEESELLKKIKEAIERINSSEWSLAGIRELIDKFSTTNQFDLQAIEHVEENMKEQNMELEIGVFSLTRIMEKARQELVGKTDTDSDTEIGVLGLLHKQEEEKEKTAIQTAPEESNENISLNIEA